MKRLVFIFFAWIFFAANITAQGFFIVDGVLVKYGWCDINNVVIPDVVTSIGKEAFKGCLGLVSIEIPSSVTSIGKGAFNRCTNLTIVRISDSSITSIEDSAFFDCFKLKSIVIPNTVTSIGVSAFSGCRLTSVIIPNSVTSIGEHAFVGCELTSVIIPNSVTSIGRNAFPCASLTAINVSPTHSYYTSEDGVLYNKNKTEFCIYPRGKSGAFSIPNSVTSIGNAVFGGCTGLTSIKIPSSVTSIGSSAFVGCTGLTSIEIPSSVTSIGEHAFGASGLTSIKIPSSVTSIGTGVFSECSSLTSIEIPSSVMSIGERAFFNCTKLTSIEIPNSVTSIGKEAFFNCIGLTSIKMPSSSVTSIGERAFEHCSKLTSVTIPNSVTSIGAYAFQWCSGLTSVRISNSITSIGDYVFSKCSKLTSVTIPNSVTSIGAAAFFDCSSLASVEIPNSVTSIGASAFSGCSSLASVEIPNSVTSIGASAFFWCSGLTSVVVSNSVISIGTSAFSYCFGLTSIEIPSSVTSIGVGAFSSCGKLSTINVAPANNYYASEGGVLYNKDKTELCLYPGGKGSVFSIPNFVTSIGASAFKGCSNLVSVEIPNSVTSIGASAFHGCSNLASVEIPNSVTSIGEEAFYSSAKKVIVNWTTPLAISESVFYDVNSLTLCVPEGTKADYLATPGWQDFGGIMEGEIDDFEFYGSILVKYHGAGGHVVIPNGVTSIRESAFSDCSSLTSVKIPASVTSIGRYAFSNCSGLTSVEIPNSITGIWDYVFYGCSSLASVEIPNSVIIIGKSAFSDCSSLASVEIPNSVTSIMDYVFSGCRSLVSVEIPNSVTNIGASAFNGCINLTSIEIPNSVTTIEQSAFGSCSNLKSVTVNWTTPVSVGTNAFLNLSTITLYVPDGTKAAYRVSSSWQNFGRIIEAHELLDFEIVDDVLVGYRGAGGHVAIPDVASIGRSVFQDCSSLTSVEIPRMVTRIEESAFSGCSGLTSVVFLGSSVTSIGSKAFSGCSNLTSAASSATTSGIVIPNSVTSIGDSAFLNCSSATSVIISYSVADIGKGAFSGCSLLSAINVNSYNSNYASADGVLYNKNKTTLLVYPSGKGGSFLIPNTVTNIGTSAFSGCSGLTSVEIPGSVAGIGDFAFAYCSGLSDVTVNWTTPVSVGSTVFYNGMNLSGITLYVPAGSKTAYQSAPVWKNFGTISETGGVPGNSDFEIVYGVLVGYHGAGGQVVIPDEVTGIERSAFQGCSSLTSVKIPALLTYIADAAFAGCVNLSAINADPANSNYASADGVLYNKTKTMLLVYPSGKDGTFLIPNTVTYIGTSAFSGCSGLTSVEIPASVAGIGNFAFAYCSGLRDVTVNQAIPLSISTNVFDNLTLSGINLHVPDGTKAAYLVAPVWQNFGTIKEMNEVPGNSDFEIINGILVGYRGAGGQVVIPDEVTGIERSAFQGCSSLTSVEIPAPVTNIADAAFAGCVNLSAINVDPANSNYASGNGVLYNKTKTTLLVYPLGKGGAFLIPNSVTGIGDGAFYACGNLLSVGIPNTVTNIGTSAFYGCSGLTSVEIPGSVAGIGDFAFAHCSGLSTVSVDRTIPVPVGGSAFNNGVNPQSLTLYVPAGARAAYQAAPVWKDFGTIIERSEVPGSSDFEIVNGVLVRYRGAGGRVVIPNEVTGIGNKAFVNCVGLTSVEIPGMVTSVGDSAFYGCISLASVEIPSPVASIGKGAFGRCISLASVGIAGSVVSIGELAFEGCISLLSVEIPASVASIGRNAFGGCSSLFTVEANAANSHYLSADGVLYNRNKTELYIYPAGKSGDFLIPGSVVSVGAYAFSDCRGLRSVEIPKSVASLGSNAFGGCSGLKDVTVEWAVPLLPAAGASVFESVSLSVCTLHVPVGAGAVYKAANVWKDFGTVTEITPELTVPSEEIAFAFGGGRDSVTVVSNMGWTVASGGSPWLTVTPASGGFGRDTIRLTAVANTGTLVRRETLVFKGGGITRYVAVVQETNPVDNAVIGSTEIVYAGGRLSVNTPVSERITVYALSGVIVYQSQKMPGSATFDLTGLPRGLMIVRGDSGWVKKIVR